MEGTFLLLSAFIVIGTFVQAFLNINQAVFVSVLQVV